MSTKEERQDCSSDGEGVRKARSARHDGSRATRAAKKARSVSRTYGTLKIADQEQGGKEQTYLILALSSARFDENIPCASQEIGCFSFAGKIEIAQFRCYFQGTVIRITDVTVL